MRRTVVAILAAAAALLGGSAAIAQQTPPQVLVFRIEGTTFPRFVNRPPVSGVVDSGGIAMLRGPDPAGVAIDALESAGLPVIDIPASGDPGMSIGQEIDGSDGELLVIVIGLVPTEGLAAEGPDTLLIARGQAGELMARHNDLPLSTLTSDSTRRDGIVTPADVVVTVRQVGGVEVPGGDGGSLIRIEATEPPVGVYEKYLQYKDLSAPIQAAVGLWELVVGGLALWALAGRGLRRLALGAALSLPVLFLALLQVGHLPTLSYASVLPVLVGVSAVAGVVLVRVADRSGVGAALAWAGGIGLGGLVLESLIGWTAAFAPMLGGSQLDGARFFGLPNAFLGLALGGAVLLAARIRSVFAGASLIAAAGLWAGAPWFGSDIGGAITLLAAAGIWWGIRGERGWVRTGIATAACVAVGAAVVVFAHRELTDAPTHITRFVEASGPGAYLDKAIDRLEIGLRLLLDQPPALIPVIGTLAGLFVVLVRPPLALRSGFRLEPSSRSAALAILAGSVVAYLANDTGAAALGLGFGTAMVCLFAVSLAAAREKMDA